MVRILLIIAGVLAAIVVIFLIVVAMQPSDFTITRSAKMAAPPAAVFEQVNDFPKWTAWSPWEKLDPNLKRTYSGAESGVGAGYAWVGNDEVGEGRMTITESKPSELVRIKLEFLKPMEAVNTTDFEFKPEGDQTLVVWSMKGENSFVGKAFCLFMDMDKLIGGDFEKGLNNMKSVVEAKPTPTPEPMPAMP